MGAMLSRGFRPADNGALNRSLKTWARVVRAKRPHRGDRVRQRRPSGQVSAAPSRPLRTAASASTPRAAPDSLGSRPTGCAAGPGEEFRDGHVTVDFRGTGDHNNLSSPARENNHGQLLGLDFSK